MNNRHVQWLKQLTSLPTAPGREGPVIQWIGRWIEARPALVLEQDRHGNLTLCARQSRRGRPLYLTAHMDHPAFVVRRVKNAQMLTAEFRGRVQEEYFPGAQVRWHGEDGPGPSGTVEALRAKTGRMSMPQARIRFQQAAAAGAGDVLTWDLPAARIKGDRLYAPACDDLAGVAAALSAMDVLLCRRDRRRNIRLLFTRAEEMGFVGAIAACKTGTLPRNSRVVVLECSRSFAESPVGGGPIVRVGDRTSTFSSALTCRVAQIAAALEARGGGFCWQRRLMPGGTCEATAYQAYGYEATCLCLPLLNYHNMTSLPGSLPGALAGKRGKPASTAPNRARIGAEIISLRDFHNLVRLLVHVVQKLDDAAATPPLRRRLEDLYLRGGHLLREGACQFPRRRLP